MSRPTLPKICAIVLAAGRSRRMPSNKLLAPLNGKPVIRHTVEAVTASRADPVIVVTGYQAGGVRDVLRELPVVIVENIRFADGLSESLKCGVKSLPQVCDGFLVVLGDMPFVPAAVIDQLIEAFDPEEGRAICVPVSGGRQGNPVLWTNAIRADFLALNGDRGAKHLMALHGDLLYELEVATDAVLTDLDTEGDFPKP